MRLSRFPSPGLAYVEGIHYLCPRINQLTIITMSKGNMLLGYARGKVGSLVFARRKGEQITRARNFSPANPRTNAQMSQRMKMYAPVQLYKQSMRSFFKFAFPTKGSETIFNAFMRENISIAPWVAKELSVASAPVPYPARMSSGGLIGYTTILGSAADLVADTMTAAVDGDENISHVSIKISEGSTFATLGEISTKILAENPSLAVGDQLTFVCCHTSGLSVEGGRVLYDGVSPFDFKYAKFVLDPNSTRSVISAGLSAALADGGGMYVRLGYSADFTTDAFAGCVIVTRNDGSNVVASNSSLVLNDVASEVYDLMHTEAYRDIAATSYKASADAYLNPATTEV